MITIRKSIDRVTQFERVVWDVFFKSRNRGISLPRHFPWISDGENSAYYMVAELDGQVVGGLVVRAWESPFEDQKVNLGLIGLVCVEPIYRGRGIASSLLSATVAQAIEEGFDALTLWTGKPDLYKVHGFVGSDVWTYGWARKIKTIQSDANLIAGPVRLIEMPSAAIPPFALSVHELVGAQSSVSLVKDITGWIVTGYSGDARNAALSMQETLPESWRINVERDDPLRDELKYLGFTLDINPVNLQMWSRINLKISVNQMVEKVRIPVLERI